VRSVLYQAVLRFDVYQPEPVEQCGRTIRFLQ
jgi:hypothetical protein